MMPFGAYDNHLLYMTADIHRSVKYRTKIIALAMLQNSQWSELMYICTSPLHRPFFMTFQLKFLDSVVTYTSNIMCIYEYLQV
jgi:hypothetical protein